MYIRIANKGPRLAILGPPHDQWDIGAPDEKNMISGLHGTMGQSQMPAYQLDHPSIQDMPSLQPVLEQRVAL